MTVFFHRLAAREYRDSRRWYDARSEVVAKRFRVAVGRAVDCIVSERDALPILCGDYRWVRVRRFPYILIFRFRAADQAMVVAVTHTRFRSGRRMVEVRVAQQYRPLYFPPLSQQNT